MRILSALLSCFLVVGIYSQDSYGESTFLYYGHRAGSYFVPEFTPEIYAARFNEGYSFSKTDDNAVITFSPSATPAELRGKMNWGTMQNGICAGLVVEQSKQSVEFGYHQFNQKVSGERIDPVHGTEQFSLQSRSGGVYMNTIFFSNRWFKPYIGVEFGTFRLRYWYSSQNGENIRRQSLGYRSRPFEGWFGNDSIAKPAVAGDRPFYMGLNLGFHLQLVHFQGFSLDIVPQIQGRWGRIEDIHMGENTPDILSHHTNWSVSVMITKAIPKP